MSKKFSLNYCVTSTKIKSSWFDVTHRKKNIIQKIGHRGFYLYIQLYKFRLHNQVNQATFSTSISMLRKETTYSTGEVFELLKKLKSAKVIDIDNVSRWDYLIDDNGDVRDKDNLIIIATDLPQTKRVIRPKRGGKEGETETVDAPIDDKNYYVSVNFKMVEYIMSQKELSRSKDLSKSNSNERYIPLYILIIKYFSTNKPMNMKIEKIANTLGYDKDAVNLMIYRLNKVKILYSQRRQRKGGGYRYEHIPLKDFTTEGFEKFEINYGAKIDSLVKRFEKKLNKKEKVDLEEEVAVDESVIEDEVILEEDEDYWGIEAVRHGFGTPKKNYSHTYQSGEDLISDMDLDELEESMS